MGFCKSWAHMKQYGVGHIRRSARMGDPAKWLIRNIEPVTGKEYVVKVPSFTLKYRNCVRELWNFLMKDPLPTTRQIKFCDPGHMKYQVKFGKKEVYWFESWFQKPVKLIKASPKLKLPKTSQSLFHFDSANRIINLRWRA